MLEQNTQFESLIGKKIQRLFRYSIVSSYNSPIDLLIRLRISDKKIYSSNHLLFHNQTFPANRIQNTI